MNTMKYVRPAAIALTSLTIGANAAFAGGMAEPVQMAPDVIQQETAASSSSAGLLVPLIILVILIPLLTRGGGTPAEIIVEGGS